MALWATCTTQGEGGGVGEAAFQSFNPSSTGIMKCNHSQEFYWWLEADAWNLAQYSATVSLRVEIQEKILALATREARHAASNSRLSYETRPW